MQSINARQDPAQKQRLLAGELNVLACDCGRRTQLASDVVYSDPDADYLCRVCPGDEAEMERAGELFRAAGATGTLRLVPSLNALVEKVKLVDAGLEDWAIEMTKVLLLAAQGDIARVLLFDRVDREDQIIHWLLFDEDNQALETVSSKLEQYDRLAAHTPSRPEHDELRVDRAWAVGAVQELIATSN